MSDSTVDRYDLGIDPVPEETLREWLALANGIRALSYVISRLAEPATGSELDADDAWYPEGNLSKWTRAYMAASVEHLDQWADLAIPRRAHSGPELLPLHFRPQLMLGRAGLECGAQALWILAPVSSGERVQRHLKLMTVDLQEEHGALGSIGDGKGQAQLIELIATINQAAPVPGSKGRLPHVSYRDIIRQSATAAMRDADAWLHLWQKSSAATHGRRWILDYAYDVDPENDLESQAGLSLVSPRAVEVSEIVAAAYEALSSSVVRYCSLGGLDLDGLWIAGQTYAYKVLPANPGEEDLKASAIAALEAHLAQKLSQDSAGEKRWTITLAQS